MPIRKLVERATYSPETMAVIFDAFDAAWVEIAVRFTTDDPEAFELARNRLATAILSVAKPDATDVSALKSEALAAFDQMSPFRDRA